MELKGEVCYELLQDVCHGGQYTCNYEIPSSFMGFCELTYNFECRRRVRGPSLNTHSLFEAPHLTSLSANPSRGRESHGFQIVPSTYAFYVARLALYLGHSAGFAGV